MFMLNFDPELDFLKSNDFLNFQNNHKLASYLDQTKPKKKGICLAKYQHADVASSFATESLKRSDISIVDFQVSPAGD